MWGGGGAGALTAPADPGAARSCELWNVEHCVDGKPPADKLAELCSTDIVFMVGPQARPQVGLEKVKAGWENFPPGWKSAGWTVVNQIAVGDTVMNERIDRFDVGGTIVAMPCAVRGPAACRVCSLPSDGVWAAGDLEGQGRKDLRVARLRGGEHVSGAAGGQGERLLARIEPSIDSQRAYMYSTAQIMSFSRSIFTSLPAASQTAIEPATDTKMNASTCCVAEDHCVPWPSG